MFILSIVSGVLIILSAVFLLRKEFLKAVKQQHAYLEQAKVFDKENLSQLLLDMQKSIDDMNQAFYDIANDLEGKYSIHEKELSDVIRDLGRLSEQLKSVSYNVENLSDLVCKLSEEDEQSRLVRLNDDEANEETTRSIEINRALEAENVILQPPILSEEKNDVIFEQKVENLVPEGPAEPRERSLEDIEMNDKILSLSKLGYDKRQIAKEMGIGLGALELIIKLNALDL